MTSRIGKLLVETTRATRLVDAEALRARDVTLVVADTASPVLLRSAVAVTLRCFTGEVNVRSPGGWGVHPVLARSATAEAVEYGTPERVVFDATRDDLVLGLGCRADGIFIDAGGWRVAVNELLPACAVSAPAACFAAAAGVAKLFAAIIGRQHSVIREAWSAPLLDMPPNGGDGTGDAAVDLGRVIVVGAGAIGSGLGHVLRLSNFRGSFIWVDDDRYEEPNHETTFLISRRDAISRARKAATLAERLRSPERHVTPEQLRICAAHPLLSEPADALVCAVDNVETRQVLDATSARGVFNAGVGGTREDAGHVLWTRHTAGEPPLSTHYRSHGRVVADATPGPSDVVTDECSRLAYQSVSLAAPFMGLAAGALLAVGLVQHALGTPAPTNYFKIDLLGLQRWVTRRVLATREPAEERSHRR